MINPPSVVILGAGTAGTLTANKLRRRFGESEVSITVIDQNDDHVYQPGLLFVPFGEDPESLVRPRSEQFLPSINFVEEAVQRVDIDQCCVEIDDGIMIEYDVLVVASGCTLLPDETDGLLDAGWHETVHSFYDLESATVLASALESFDRGRLVVNIIDLPIKCPVAPLEFAFLADALFRKRGVREQITITFATPLDGAFTKPVAAAALQSLLDEHHIELVTEFNTGEVDGTNRRLIGFDGTVLEFDLAVVVPLHGGAPFIEDSVGLGDELGFVPTNNETLQSTVRPNVFALGDAADTPASKAGSAAHFQGEVLVENIARFLDGVDPAPAYDGHTNCFIETGDHKALLIDFNYDTEPLPGHYPTAVGLPLLQESRLNHYGKLLFERLYWQSILPGRDLPFIGSEMPTRGKNIDNPPTQPNPTKKVSTA